ncbi:MAG TPA: M20/M25/M40 family metallo-hydrolase [Candidatus Lokiarchaeia archaeon]|nr:M20/M25/M40 family metallo-hydrolase [Candidatus Lokiarchaeia archaeon]
MPKKAPPSQRDRLHLLDQFKPGTPPATMAIDLLQMMIRVDTSNPPGNEIELATKLEAWVQSQGMDLVTTRIFESEPGRADLIVDIPGTEPESHPSWGFMSHLDVVPAEGTWTYPPFAAEIVEAEHDSFIWGRGAMDIKYMGAAHLTAAFTLLSEGFRPKGNIKILLCADEECGGHKGLDWLAQNHPDAIKVDCCLNEGGGFKIPLKDDFVIQTGEKGIFWTKFKIHGKGGHGSMPPPHNTTAIYKMVAALERLKKFKPKMIINKEYISTIDAMSIPGAIKFLLKRKSLLRGLLNLAGKVAKVNLAQVVLPLVSDSIAVTNFHSGMKENSISPDAEITLDIRTLPGHGREHVNAMIRKAIGAELFDQMEWEARDNQMCTTSTTDNEYYKIIENIAREIYPGANLVPMLSAGSTDCKFYRERGMHAYGFCPVIKDEDMTYAQLLALAHNADERISLTNLLLGVDFNYRIMKQV